MVKEAKQKTENKKLTFEQQRQKLVKKVGKYNVMMKNLKLSYEAITPNKIRKYPEYVDKKKEYKRQLDAATEAQKPFLTKLKEMNVIYYEAVKLKKEGKDTSHLGYAAPRPKGRPKKQKVEFKTETTPGAPLTPSDYTPDEWKQRNKLKRVDEDAMKVVRSVDESKVRAKRRGLNVVYDQEEYDEQYKIHVQAEKDLKELHDKVRARVGKQDIITQIPIEPPPTVKKPRGRPKKDKVETEKRARGRPKGPVKEPIEKRARGRPKKNIEPVEEVKVDVKEVAKEVVSKNLKSILDDIIKEHTSVKVVKPKQVKPKKDINPQKPMKIVKINKHMDEVETITTKNYKEQIDNDIVEAPAQDVMPHKEILSYLFDTFGSLTKKMSKRFEQRIKPLQQSSKQALHDQLSYKQNANDFHPTPQKCLNEHVQIRVDEYTNILEPSAGFGSVLYYLLDKYPNVKITAYEMFDHIYAFLKNEYPTVKTIRMNFLESNPKNNTYDIIICNPPFTVGSYDGVKNKTGYDSRFYYNFLFKCFEYMYYSKTKTYECGMIFISPALFEEDTEGKKGVRDFNKLINISHNKKMEILKQSTYLTETYTKKNVNDVFDRYVDDIQPAQIQCKGKCQFQTTGAGVYFYECFFFKNNK